MKTTLENGVLTVYLAGRIDSTNAEQAGAELDQAREQNPHESIVLDADALEYISSAGLRVVLRTRKAEPTLKIINASSEVYDIFEMTGFTEMLPVEKAMRKMSVDGCKIIGQGAKGTVYRYNGDTIVKVYKNPDSLPDILNERKLARRAFVLGIPTAISYDVVRVGESYGSVFELLDAKSYSQLIVEDPANMEKYVGEYAELLRKIHSTKVEPGDMRNIKPQILRWLSSAAKVLKPEQVEKLEKLINAVPEDLQMLHFDYHTNNVMSQNGETLLIDMDTLSYGHPIFELANVYITYVGFGVADPSNVENFLGIPYETAKKIWEIFLPAYLGTEDAAKIADVEKKARLLCSLRMIHHTTKRKQEETEIGKKVIEAAVANVEEILPTVEDLTF